MTKIEVRNGLRIKNHDETLNFALTSMQICGLLFFDKTFSVEGSFSIPKNIDELRYSDLFAKIILLKKEDEINLSKDETVLFYIAVNMATQCFVSDREEMVKSMIPYLSEISEEDYISLRKRFISNAQEVINLVNKSFKDDPEFSSELNLLSDGSISMSA
jgi:hypothetical protein